MQRRRWLPAIYVHPIFFFTLAVYALGGHLQQAVLAFLAISLHELTHAVIAESYGLEVERLELWPFGGIARIQGLGSQDPEVEVMVAVAGPVQNFLLATALWTWQGSLGLHGPLVREFIAINLGLGALNLLPAEPLDGGRLARVYLARRLGRRRAEDIVRQAGRWLAGGIVALCLAGLAFGRIWLGPAMWAGFLYWAGRRGERQSGYWMMRDVAVRSLRFWRSPIWPLDDLAVRETTPIGQVMAVMRPMRYHRVSVLDGEFHRLGVLYEDDLVFALGRHGPELPIGDLLGAR